MNFELMPKLSYLWTAQARTRHSFWLQLSFHGEQEEGLGQCYPKHSPPVIKTWWRIKSLQCLWPGVLWSLSLPPSNFGLPSVQKRPQSDQVPSRMHWHHKPQATDDLEGAVWTPSINHVWACWWLRIQEHRHNWIDQALLPSWASLGKLPCPHRQTPCSNAAFSHWAALCKPS